VKERVLSTFQQTLNLYKKGRADEAVAGCNLLLQMDPMFDPAKRLLEKARNPAAPIDVDALLPADTTAAIAEARQALGAREFERAIQITTDVLTNDLMNEEARLIADEAREKLEAGPFVEQFVKKCEQHVTSNNLTAARTALEKARALDPAHPGIGEMERMIAGASSTPSFDASSFVVESPKPARGGDKAADFGFTFEEDKPASGAGFANFSFDSADKPPAGGAGAGFSFDAPAQAPATPGFSFDTPASSGVGGEFDFSTASIETSPDDQKKIAQYLADGDRAFEAADYQGAIDVWSRIFLIDVTNEAASERIERAKAKRREAEQKVEGVLASGIAAFEKRDHATARTKFEEALRIDPGNVSAQDYLTRLESGEEPEPAFQPSAAAPSILDEEPIDSSFGAIAPPAPTPPVAIGAPRKAAPKAAPAAAKKSSSMGLIVGAVIAVAVLGGGWFAWQKFMSEPETAASAPTQNAVAQAQVLAQRGDFDRAIAMLQEIKPGDSQYDSALQMIADLQQRKARSAATIDGKPAAQYYDENVAAGRAAMSAGDFLAAKQAFDNAMRVKPLPPDVKSAYDAATDQVAQLASARQLFASRRYQEAINTLQPILDREPGNRSVQRMITDAHFNLGAMALKEERLPDALREFDLVLKADPSDELARRSRDLAQRYEGETRDLLYRIYVKYLPLRQPAG
jgi:tetratricopeptide (TPR) repeat protein